MNQQDWLEYFELLAGRKPRPEEFLEGKRTDFDLEAIKTILGLEDKEATESQADEVIAYQNEEEKTNNDEKDIPKADANAPLKENQKEQRQLQEVWQNQFEDLMGRKPTPEEFLKGKEEDFSLKNLLILTNSQKKGKSSQKSLATWSSKIFVRKNRVFLLLVSF